MSSALPPARAAGMRELSAQARTSYVSEASVLLGERSDPKRGWELSRQGWWSGTPACLYPLQQ